MKKRIIIVHGWEGSPEANWLPWLKSKLEELGHEVQVPPMPDTYNPIIRNWVQHLSTVIGAPDQNTYLIGHSIGCQTILRYLETIHQPIGGAVFVAGWFYLENLEEEDERRIAKPWLQTPIDLAKVKTVLPRSSLIISDNDPYGAREENIREFDKIVTKKVVLHADHITDTEYPEILSEAVWLLQ